MFTTLDLKETMKEKKLIIKEHNVLLCLNFDIFKNFKLNNLLIFGIHRKFPTITFD